MKRLAAGLFAATLLAACGKDANPIGPPRYGTPIVTIACQQLTDPLGCQAHVTCSLYPCAPGTPDDVTQQATWTTGDPSVAVVVGPGRVSAVAPGNTVVQATWTTAGSAFRSISVFPGTPPLPTAEIFGSVYAKGQTAATGPIDGAVVEILDGLVAGKTATSGVPPPLLPGYSGPVGGAGYYRLLGVPPGSYTVRVMKSGYATQERTVVVTATGSPSADFPLEPQ
jgi:hypothetical protein